MPPKALLPFDEFPTEVVLDLEAIRLLNRQRYELEQLTAITMLDQERRLVVGYKDHGEDEFWIRGHMPGWPILPGVLMCEAAAQLCSVYYAHFGYLQAGEVLGFGGMDDVTFRGSVVPGQRLWLVGYAPRVTLRRMTFITQGFVDGKLVYHGEILGITLKVGGAAAQGVP